MLRDRGPADLDDYLRWRQHGREWQRWDSPWEAVSSGGDREAFVKRFEATVSEVPPRPRRRLEIDLARDGRHVGWVNRYWVDELTGWLEVGIVVAEETLWGRGLGTEALALWIDYLFCSTDLVRVGLATWSGNERMIRVASKLGLSEEGRVRQARLVEGRRHDAVRYGILRPEWSALRAAWPGIAASKAPA